MNKLATFVSIIAIAMGIITNTMTWSFWLLVFLLPFNIQLGWSKESDESKK